MTMRVLLLEDEESIRKMIASLIQARGFDVVAAHSGLKAVDEATVHAPDIAILDLMMPGAIDGFEVCRRLRQNAATARTHIIVISALDDAASKKKAFEAGASLYLTKPFSALGLLKELEAVRARRTHEPPAGA